VTTSISGASGETDSCSASSADRCGKGSGTFGLTLLREPPPHARAGLAPPTDRFQLVSLTGPPAETLKHSFADFPARRDQELVSTFYDRAYPNTVSEGVTDAALAERIEAIWERSRRSYPVLRIHNADPRRHPSRPQEGGGLMRQLGTRASPGINRSIVLASAASSRCSGVTEQSSRPKSQPPEGLIISEHSRTRRSTSSVCRRRLGPCACLRADRGAA
jgi:hypothetical protein